MKVRVLRKYFAPKVFCSEKLEKFERTAKEIFVSFQDPLGQTHTHKPRKGVRGKRDKKRSACLEFICQHFMCGSKGDYKRELRDLSPPAAPLHDRRSALCFV